MRTLLQSLEEMEASAVNHLLEKKIDVNEPCSNGLLPLDIILGKIFFLATPDPEKGLEIVELLLAAGAEHTKISVDEGPLLHFLCRKRTDLSDPEGKKNWPSVGRFKYEERLPIQSNLALSIIKLLLKAPQKIDLNARNKLGETPFLIAANRADTELMQLLIAQGVDVTIPDNYGRTVLHQACSHGDRTLIKQLIEKKADLHAQTKDGATLLDYAEDSHTQLFLLQKGVSAKHKDILFYFRNAQIDKNQALIDYLFTQGLAVYEEHHRTALQETNDYDLLKRLLQNGAAIHLKNNLSCLVINWFLHFKEQEDKILSRLQLLHEYKADFRQTDSEGTFLHHSMVLRSEKFLKFFISVGLDINARNKKQQTPLHMMIEYELNVKIIKNLLAQGANPMLSDANGLIPLEYLRYHLRKLDQESLDLLLQWLELLPTKKKPKNCQALLSMGIDSDCLPMVKKLHERGVSLAEGNLDYKTNAYEFAVLKNSLQIMPWLLSTHEEKERTQQLRKLLVLAIKNYRHEIIRVLLNAGVVLNDVANDLWGNFIEGPSSGIYKDKQIHEPFNKTLNLLFEHKVDVNQKNAKGQTALEQLLDSNHQWWALAKFFLDHHVPTPKEPVAIKRLADWAIKHKDYDWLGVILGDNPSVEHKGLLKFYALKAVDHQDSNLLMALIKLGFKLGRAIFQKILNLPNSDPNKKEWVLFFINQATAWHYPIKFNYSFDERGSLLHLAAQQGWDDVLRILLQSSYGFNVDLPANNREKSVPLLFAVRKGHLAAVQVLIENGANPEIVDEKGKTLLHLVCEQGKVDLLLYLVSLKSINLNAKCHYFFNANKTHQAIHFAAIFKDKEISQKMVEILLAAGAEIDQLLMILVIRMNPAEKLFSQVWNQAVNQLPKASFLEGRFLHHAVLGNNLIACQLLLKSFPQLLEFIDARGCTPLFHATAPDRQAIFRWLIDNGADFNRVNYEGYDIQTYAFCHGTTTDLKNTDFAKNVDQLRIRLLEQKEFAQSEQEQLFSLALYCYKLVSLFGTAGAAYQYVKKHSNPESRQPIHDLCLFQLPSAGSWSRDHWVTLIMERGVAVTQYFHWAPRIEEILQHPPRSLDEIKLAAEKIKYARERENPSFAQLALLHKVPENAFNRVLDHYREKKSDFLPDIFIDGSEFKLPRYYLKKLAANDLRGFVLGSLTNCCQNIGSPGESCAMHGMTSPFGGFYVIFKRPDPKDVKRAQFLCESAIHTNTTQEFLNKFQAKNQKDKYQKKIQALTQELKKSAAEPINDKQILQQLVTEFKQDLQQVQEEKVSAQCWAWLNEDNQAIVLDSWERKHQDYDSLLFLPFITRFAEQAISRYGFDQVLIGKNGQTPQNHEFLTAKQSKTPKDYFDYRDSKDQWLVKSRQTVDHLTVATEVKELKSAVAALKNQLEVKQTPLSLTFFENPVFKLLPPLVLTAAQTSVESISTVTENFIYILPIRTVQGYWSTLIFEPSTSNDRLVYKITYLDFNGNVLPQQLSVQLHSAHQKSFYDIALIAAIYNPDPAENTLWLTETLRHFAQTQSLCIPVPEILSIIAKKQAAVVASTLQELGLFRTNKNPIDLVLDYAYRQKPNA